MINPVERPMDRETQKAITALSALKLELKHSGLLNKPQVQTLFRQLAEFVTNRSPSSAKSTSASEPQQSGEGIDETFLQQILETFKVGNTAIHQSEHEILSVHNAVVEAKKKLAHLGESSQKAEKAVSLMKHFTTQTQLLALNASLEASRAGEFGQGFSTVADEMRSLTRQLAEMMQEVEKLTQDLQSETGTTVATLAANVQKIEDCSHLVQQIQQQFVESTNATEEAISCVAGHPLE